MEPDVSGLLARWARQDPAARDELGALVHGELRKIAHHYLRNEREGHTLQTDALVNEAYVRLAGVDRLQWRDRTHFFAIAAMLMRRVLVDYARERGRDKRGGGISITSLDERVAGGTRDVDMLALDEALTRLAAIDPQQERIVELRFFGGLTVEETAGELGISPATVKRDWAIAKAWLHHELTQ